MQGSGLSAAHTNIARRNVDASFQLATSLAGAKNLADVVELQSAFWRKQAEPIRSQMARGMVGVAARQPITDVSRPNCHGICVTQSRGELCSRWPMDD